MLPAFSRSSASSFWFSPGYQFTSFGPRHLDTQHKRLYWRGYAFIIVSLLLCVFVLALPA
jgi:hypothetical protein